MFKGAPRGDCAPGHNTGDMGPGVRRPGKGACENRFERSLPADFRNIEAKRDKPDSLAGFAPHTDCGGGIECVQHGGQAAIIKRFRRSFKKRCRDDDTTKTENAERELARSSKTGCLI